MRPAARRGAAGAVLVGYLVGNDRAFALRLMAQTAPCQLQIERNPARRGDGSEGETAAGSARGVSGGAGYSRSKKRRVASRNPRDHPSRMRRLNPITLALVLVIPGVAAAQAASSVSMHHQSLSMA